MTNERVTVDLTLMRAEAERIIVRLNSIIQGGQSPELANEALDQLTSHRALLATLDKLEAYARDVPGAFLHAGTGEAAMTKTVTRYREAGLPFPFDPTAAADTENPYGKIVITGPNGEQIRLYIASRVDSDLAALQNDASRYRWLCDGHGYFMEEEGLCGHGNEKEAADKAIDERMRALNRSEKP